MSNYSNENDKPGCLAKSAVYGLSYIFFWVSIALGLGAAILIMYLIPQSARDNEIITVFLVLLLAIGPIAGLAIFMFIWFRIFDEDKWY